MNKKQLAAEILAENVRNFLRVTPLIDPRDCPADIAQEQCICEWHTAYNAMEKSEFIYRMADFQARVVIKQVGYATRVTYFKTIEAARASAQKDVANLSVVKGYHFVEIHAGCWVSDFQNELAFIEIAPNNIDAIRNQICEEM